MKTVKDLLNYIELATKTLASLGIKDPAQLKSIKANSDALIAARLTPSDLANLKTTAEMANEKVADLQSQLDAAKSDVALAHANLDVLNSTLTTLQAKYDSLNGDDTAVHAALDQASVTISDLQEQLKITNGNNNELQSQLASAASYKAICDVLAANGISSLDDLNAVVSLLREISADLSAEPSSTSENVDNNASTADDVSLDNIATTTTETTLSTETTSSNAPVVAETENVSVVELHDTFSIETVL